MLDIRRTVTEFSRFSHSGSQEFSRQKERDKEKTAEIGGQI